MKQCLAIFFLTIFSFQILPIKEIGQILFKGQITEEEVHGQHHSGSDDGKVKKSGEPPLHRYGSSASAWLTAQQIATAIHRSENLPPHFVPDILTPPPNC